MQTHSTEAPSGVKQARSKPEDGADHKARFKAMARAAVEECGEIVDATEALFDELCSDDILYRAMTAQAARELCYRMCSAQVRNHRAASWAEQANDMVASQVGRVEAQARGIREALLLDFPLFGGKLLRDATREEVEDSARKYAVLSADMDAKSRWLEAVASAMVKHNASISVGEVLSEADLRSMREGVTNA